jgi:AcrR family transcriptional regulator
MSWSKEDRSSGSRGYHHGNLKEALLGAALELIAQKGPAGFTFAEAARRARVSPAAPYRHFRDRGELLASVALRGFERFAIVLEQAWDHGRPQPLDALDRLGKAYLEFARAEPAYYSAMFELCAQMPLQSRPPALMVALHIWAMSHGVASLFGRGDAARRMVPMSPEELLEAAVLVYLRGLGRGADSI